MKRQRNSTRDGDVQVEKSEEGNRSKRAAAEKFIEEVEQEDGLAVAAAAKNWVDEWPWLKGGVVDEQMSWGYITLPKWGVEFMAEAYGDLFADVVWDYDIWNLKSIQDIPNP